MRTPTFKGTPTIQCPDDAPPGVVGFFLDRSGEAVFAQLVTVWSNARVRVRPLAGGELTTVEQCSFRLMLCGSWIPAEDPQRRRSTRRKAGGRR